MFVINGLRNLLWNLLRNLFSKAAAIQRDATKEQSLMRSCVIVNGVMLLIMMGVEGGAVIEGNASAL